MKVRIAGVRGTVATPHADRIKTGGNTTCVEVCTDDSEIIIIDAGTGLVSVGNDILQRYSDRSIPTIYLFLTHTHWDHLAGFPFSKMLFRTDVKINMYAPKKFRRTLENMITSLLNNDFSPVSFEDLPCDLTFFDMEEETLTLPSGTKITSRFHEHPGGAYGYRIEHGGKIFVFNTDVEYLGNIIDPRVVELSKDADLMFHDAQYTEDQLPLRAGWGHSSWQQAVAVSKLANVKRLGFTHHDPDRLDKEITVLERKAKKQFENSFFCREGMEIEL